MARLAIILDLPEVAHYRIDATDAANLVLHGSLPTFGEGDEFHTYDIEMLTPEDGHQPLTGTYVSARWQLDRPEADPAAVIAQALAGPVPLHDSPEEHAARILAALEARGLQVSPVGDR